MDSICCPTAAHSATHSRTDLATGPVPIAVSRLESLGVSDDDDRPIPWPDRDEQDRVPLVLEDQARAQEVVSGRPDREYAIVRMRRLGHGETIGIE